MYAQTSGPRFSKRRRRSPAPAIVVAVALLLLACWLFNLTCGRGKKEDASSLSEYTNRTRTLVEASSSIGQEWNNIRSSLDQLIADPESLDASLQNLENQALDLLGQAKGMVPPESLEGAHQALLICLEQRYRALKNFRPDIVNAISAVDLDVYAASLSEDLREMMYSDGTYLFFKRAVSEALQANNLQDITMPDSVCMPDWENAGVDKVRSFLISLRGTELHGLAVGQVQLDPKGTLSEEGGENIHRLPSVSEVNVTVTVENQGNRPESGVVVTISLYSTINTTPTRQDRTIENIGPGEKVQVVFTGLTPTTGGVRNILEIKVEPVPKESFIQNNQKLIYFTIG